MWEHIGVGELGEFGTFNGFDDLGDSELKFHDGRQVMQCTQLRRLELDRSFLIDCKCARFQLSTGCPKKKFLIEFSFAVALQYLLH